VQKAERRDAWTPLQIDQERRSYVPQLHKAASIVTTIAALNSAYQIHAPRSLDFAIFVLLGLNISCLQILAGQALYAALSSAIMSVIQVQEYVTSSSQVAAIYQSPYHCSTRSIMVS
jgi:hypothetical protein